ncbi:13694_t:CDS:10, partial [Acaulospora colombiana]
NERPKQGLDIIQSRLKGIKSLNLEVAEYFKERAVLEDNYVKGLQRLANKPFISDKSNLGVWDILFNETNELIEIHSAFIKRVHEEVEAQLREKVTSDSEWAQLKQHETNLSKLAREHEEKHAKVNKKRSKTEKLVGKKAESFESKLMEVQRAFEQTHNEWTDSWSQFLERIQAVDMSRLLKLKEILVGFETIQAESYQNRTLNSIMDFDAQNEIEFFCAKKSGVEESMVSQMVAHNGAGNESDGFKSSSSVSNFQNGQAPSSTSKVSVNEGSSISTSESNQVNGSLSDVGVRNSTYSTLADPSMGSPSNTAQSPTSFEFPESVNYQITAPGSEVYPHGLHAIISETINVMSKRGDIVKIFVTGEISISYNFPTIEDHSTPIRIRIKNFEALEKFVLNTSYMRDVPESPGLYDIDTSSFSLLGGAPVAVMKYQLKIDHTNRNLFVPLQVIPQWKCDPNLTLVMINYQANPECLLSGKLTDLSFIIPVDGKVETAQSNPTGVWSTEKQMMYWKADDIDLAVPPERKRILARFETLELSKHAPATIKFVCKGQLLSKISLEIQKVIPNGNGVHEHDGHLEIDDIFKFKE